MRKGVVMKTANHTLPNGGVLARVKSFFLTHSMETYLECQDVMFGSFLRDYMADEQSMRVNVMNSHEMLREFLKDLMAMEDEILTPENA